MLKPPGSPHDPALPTFPFKVLFANDERQLRAYLGEFCSDGRYPMFQECVFGPAHNLCCFAVDGEVVAMSEYDSLRQHKGQGIMRRIIENTPEAEECARRLLGALRWDGLAQCSFVVDRRTGRPCYMETNGRIWSSIAGSVYAGWDFPVWVYRYFRFGEPPEPGPVDIGSLNRQRRTSTFGRGPSLALQAARHTF